MALKKVCDIRDYSYAEKIEMNLISFFDYGLLNIGAYFNINVGQSGDYVNDISALEKIEDPRGYTKWAGNDNWVYESGVNNSSVNFPPEIYVDNSLYNLASVNYRDGYVYNIPSSATSVQAKYSYKWVTVTSTRKSNIGRKLQTGSVNDSITREFTPSLPIISFEVPPKDSGKRYGLGGSNPQILTYKVKSTILARNDNDAVRLAEVVASQKLVTINTFDPDSITNSGDFPLDYNGFLNSGKNHDQLASQYPWNFIYIKNTSAKNGKFISENLYEAFVDLTIEVLDCGCI